MKRITKKSLLTIISSIVDNERQLYESYVTLFGSDCDDTLIRLARYEESNTVLLTVQSYINRRKPIREILEVLNQIYNENLKLCQNLKDVYRRNEFTLRSQIARASVTSRILRTIICYYHIKEVDYDILTTTW